jgi:hypothetical protein
MHLWREPLVDIHLSVVGRAGGATARCRNRVGLNIPQIKLLAIWVGGMHCVIVTKLCGARFFGGGGFKHAPQKVGGNKIIYAEPQHKAVVSFDR